MASSERCELTDLPKDGCAHCTGDTLGDERNMTKPHVFRAQFKGPCHGCWGLIMPGQMAARAAGEDFFVHEECQ